jgi:hypothetical protein
MTRARGAGIALIIVTLGTVGLGLLLPVLGIFLPPLASVVGALAGIPLLGLTWAWVRWTATRGERVVLVLVGLGWLLVLGAIVAMLAGAEAGLRTSAFVFGAYIYFPLISALILLALSIRHWRHLPAHDPAITLPDGTTFTPQRMVDWLAPTQLARTAVKAGLSAVFGEYADKREVQAALHPWSATTAKYDADYSDHRGDLWFDFVADLGDGFNATYAVAWLLARPELTLPGEATSLPRGRFLVLGGDQVYPTASREEYQHRFRGPYEAALPSAPRPMTMAAAPVDPLGARRFDPDSPDLYAIPGNHDWYDGLTSFTRLFCQSRRIGRWATSQARSYFAVRLPQGWWLWGVDIQLASDIDRPQLEYFSRVAADMRKDCPDPEHPPRLILCTGQPTWTDCGAECPDRHGLRHAEPHRFDNEAFLEDRIIRPHGVRLVVTLSGDLHHYMRYEEQSRGPGDETTGAIQLPRPDEHGGVQRITSGGGGAYLYPTHHMPNAIELDEAGEKVRYGRKGVFPSVAASHAWARRIALMPLRNLTFTMFLGCVYLLFAWTLQSASKAHPVECGRGSMTSVMECLRWETNAFGVLSLIFQVLKHSPSNVVFAAIVVYGLFKFRASEDDSAGQYWGAVHGVSHVLLNGAMIWAISVVNLGYLGLDLERPIQIGLFVLEMLIGGGMLGAILFALYLWLSSQDHGRHINEVFSSQHIPDCKNFLRMRIDERGTLEIHPIGVPHVPGERGWHTRSAVKENSPESVVEPKAGTIPITRIEDPISCL